MVYRGTSKTETIWISPVDDAKDVHYIELIQAEDDPVFYVTTCCNEDWVWAFRMDGTSNYEMVKHAIMDAAFGCDSAGELLDVLDEVFDDYFGDILVEDSCECDGRCCENCNHRDCLN